MMMSILLLLKQFQLVLTHIYKMLNHRNLLLVKSDIPVNGGMIRTVFQITCGMKTLEHGYTNVIL